MSSADDPRARGRGSIGVDGPEQFLHARQPRRRCRRYREVRARPTCGLQPLRALCGGEPHAAQKILRFHTWRLVKRDVDTVTHQYLKGAITHSAPEGRTNTKRDAVEAGAPHHPLDFGGREAVFEPGTKPVERIGPHRIKGPVFIKREREPGPIATV